MRGVTASLATGDGLGVLTVTVSSATVEDAREAAHGVARLVGEAARPPSRSAAFRHLAAGREVWRALGAWPWAVSESARPPDGWDHAWWRRHEYDLAGLAP